MILVLASLKFRNGNYKTGFYSFDNENNYNKWFLNDNKKKVIGIHEKYISIDKNKAEKLWQEENIYVLDEKKSDIELFNIGIDVKSLNLLKENVKLLIKLRFVKK